MEKVSNPLISIIIPAYNVEKYISKCINSILNQTYKNLEIIIINDGSIDNTKSICEGYKDDRIKIINTLNGGVSKARNIGFDNVKGDLITFIDPDDYVDSDYISLLYNNLIEENADISITSHKIVTPKKTYNKYSYSKYVSDSKNILDKLLYDEGIDTSLWAKLYKKELFDNVRCPEGKIFEDTSVTYKLISKAKKIVVDLKPTYNYVIRPKSITNEFFNIKKLDLIDITTSMTNDIRNMYPSLSKGCDRRLMFSYLATLTQLARVDEKNIDIKKSLMKYINANRKKVLKDKRIPKRDRIALITTIFGFNIFKLFWKVYEKASGK